MRRKNITTEMMKSYISQSLFLLMEKSPYDVISIGEITAKAGVNRSTYYRNFASKEDIIRFFLNGIMEQYMAAYAEGEKQSLETYLQTLFDHFYVHKKELLLLYRNRLSYLMLEIFNGWFTVPEGSTSGSIQERYRVAYHVGGIYNHLTLWFSHGMEEQPTEMVQIAMSILPDGFQPLLLKNSIPFR